MAEAIMIGGPARSGTSVMAYVLARHPLTDIYLSGPQSKLMETDLLPHGAGKGDASKIKAILESQDDLRYVIFKRAWLGTYPDWLKKHFPSARYIMMTRNFEDINKSWITTGAFADPKLSKSSLQERKARYKRCIKKGERFKDIFRYCRIVDYDRMVSDTKEVFAEMAKFLELSNDFDYSIVSPGAHWDNQLYKELRFGGD